MAIFDERLEQLITEALSEDTGDGDHTTLSCIPPQQEGKAILKIKDDGILAGVDIAHRIFSHVESAVSFAAFKKDGDAIQNGETGFEISGHIHTILRCERLVLNCMQRMSGIATVTRKYVEKLAGYKTKLLDTRKTTPNFRLFEKWAVQIGGGTNHRFGLYDMIMIKDNHVDASGGIAIAIQKAHDYLLRTNKKLKIEKINHCLFLHWFFIGYWILKRGSISMQPFFIMKKARLQRSGAFAMIFNWILKRVNQQ